MFSRGWAFFTFLCNADSNRYKLHGMYSMPSNIQVSATNLYSQSQTSWWPLVVKRYEEHKSVGCVLLRAVLHDSKVRTAQSLFLAVLAGQSPSLNASSSSIVILNKNLPLCSLIFFSPCVFLALACNHFNLSNFKNLSLSSELWSGLFSATFNLSQMQQGHHSSKPKQKLL